MNMSHFVLQAIISASSSSVTQPQPPELPEYKNPCNFQHSAPVFLRLLLLWHLPVCRFLVTWFWTHTQPLSGWTVAGYVNSTDGAVSLKAWTCISCTQA